MPVQIKLVVVLFAFAIGSVVLVSNLLELREQGSVIKASDQAAYSDGLHAKPKQ